MPFAHFKTTVDAPATRLWSMLKEKIRRPEKFLPGVVSVEIPKEYGPNTVERIMVIEDGKARKTVHEIVSADEATMTVIFKLKNDPIYTGFVSNTVFEERGRQLLDFTMNWTLKDSSLLIREPDWEAAIKQAAIQAKEMAEGTRRTLPNIGRLQRL